MTSMRRFFSALLALVLVAAVPNAARADERECVVLLHGVAVSSWTMSRLAGKLEAAGYRTINLSYPSRDLPLEQIALELLPEQLRIHDIARAPKVHFVTHSMGSIVARLYLRDHRPANLGRVVMLGPPNQGSAAADVAARHTVLRWALGLNLERVGTGTRSLSNQLGPADFELGIIAGSSQINPLFNHVLDRPHDGAVAVEAARLDGMKDFLVVPYSHTLMLWRSAVSEQVIAFLRDGHFIHPTAKAAP